jgi:bleomycin hydrolase
MGQPNSKPDTFDEKKAEMLSSCQDICQGVQDITLDKEYPSNLSPEQLEQFSCQFWKLDKNVLAMNAVMNNDPLDVMVNPSVRNQDQHVFNVKIETEGVATNQKQSGRCWLFAGKKDCVYHDVKILYFNVHKNRNKCTPSSCHSQI